MSTAAAPLLHGHAHLAALRRHIECLDARVDEIDAWGRCIATVLESGGRLLAVGNGGSAAQAQHLTSELVGRYRDDRRPFSALALHAESSSVTAIANDYAFDEVFARQVVAHGRRGDVLVALSTSGRSRNVLAAACVARDIGMRTFALTGPAPNPLAGAVDDVLAVDAPATATVQEAHQIVVHLLCAAIDIAVGASVAAPIASAASDGREAEVRAWA
jgi:D-sedoheptulose 7-phosphate isomerase